MVFMDTIFQCSVTYQKLSYACLDQYHCIWLYPCFWCMEMTNFSKEVSLSGILTIPSPYYLGLSQCLGYTHFWTKLMIKSPSPQPPRVIPIIKLLLAWMEISLLYPIHHFTIFSFIILTELMLSFLFLHMLG